jgi:hypothetical protein
MFRVLFLTTLLGAACGPIEYITTVSLQASKVVEQAKDANAETLAPYEYTIAAESLHKARELAGHARWQQALSCGQTALEYGRKAASMAQAKQARPDEQGE